MRAIRERLDGIDRDSKVCFQMIYQFGLMMVRPEDIKRLDLVLRSVTRSQESQR